MFSDTLRKLRKEKNLTQRKLADMLVVDCSTVTKWETGKAFPDYEKQQQLADIFNVSLDYLLGRTSFTDEENQTICANVSQHLTNFKTVSNDGVTHFIPGEVISAIQKGIYKFSYDTLNNIAHAINADASDLMKSEDSAKSVFIPILGYVRAGIPIEAVEDILDYEEITPEMASQGEHFALKVKGDSMEPKFSAGDVVIVRKQNDVDTGEIAIVLVNGDEATIKKIKKQEDGISLIASNPAYEIMFYNNKEIETLPVQIIGKVVELRAKF